jgi:hypothetical protein
MWRLNSEDGADHGRNNSTRRILEMDEYPKAIGRRSFITGLAGATVATAMAAMSVGTAKAAEGSYADPKTSSLPKSEMKLHLERAALVVIDPQIDFLSPKGGAWSILGESVTEHKTVANLTRLFKHRSRRRSLSRSPRITTILTTTGGNLLRRLRSSSTNSVCSIGLAP